MGSVAAGQLGKYQLVRRLAVGGMAELFLARATASHGFEKLVVLKRILPSFAQDPAFTTMFLTEARLAAGLDHPNIAHVFDFGEHDGSYYFTMEYVRGRDLRQVVRAARDNGKPLSLSVVLQVIVGMLAGLHHAHEHRDATGRPLEIVHRDISPANVLITYEGDVKLVDFGIAKAVALGPSTVAGTLKGKIAYMSPEQCRGDTLDRRSDLFSIGTLLWELTVGRRLFGSGTNTNELTLLRTVDEAVVQAPAEVVPGYPPELNRIVVKALSRDPGDRFQTALEFRVALEELAVEARLPISSANTARFMNDLFPLDEREGTALNGGDHGTQAPEASGRKISTTHTLPGGFDELTRPERSAPRQIETLVSDPIVVAQRRRYLPLVASIGAVLLFSGGALALFGGALGDGEESSPAAASLIEASDDPAEEGAASVGADGAGAGASGSIAGADAASADANAASAAEPDAGAASDASAADPSASADEPGAPNDLDDPDADGASADPDETGTNAADNAEVTADGDGDSASPDDDPAPKSKKRRKKSSKSKPDPAAAETEPEPEPTPPPKTEPKGDDPFMAPDPTRRRGNGPFF